MKQRILYILPGILIGILIGGLAGYWIGLEHSPKKTVSTYEECVAAGYPILESSPARCNTPDGKYFIQPGSEPEHATTFDGTVVCLLHKDTTGPQTLECALGIKTNDGKYYSLHSEPPDNALSGLAGSERKVRIAGSLKKEASTQYQSEGVITVDAFAYL